MFFGQNNPSLPPDYQLVCSLKEIQSYSFFMKANVDKLERNYIDIWGLGAIAPRSQRHFKESDKMEA